MVLGSEALRNGLLTRHQLQRHHHRILPDVYIPRDHEIGLHDRAAAAWLWSRRRAIVGGLAAAALHGAKWVDDETPVELIWNNGRPPAGLIVRNERLRCDEVTNVAGLPVTTAARTAFDLGRHLPRKAAVTRLDALMRATRFQTDEVLALADLHRGARHLRRLR